MSEQHDALLLTLYPGTLQLYLPPSQQGCPSELFSFLFFFFVKDTPKASPWGLPTANRPPPTANRQPPTANRHQSQVPLVPDCCPATEKLPDMSLVASRSCSPGHLTYLTNMGVAGTFVLAVIVDSRLWGLIVCHHLTPKYVPFAERVVGTLLSETIGLFIKLHQVRLLLRACALYSPRILLSPTQWFASPPPPGASACTTARPQQHVHV